MGAERGRSVLQMVRRPKSDMERGAMITYRKNTTEARVTKVQRTGSVTINRSENDEVRRENRIEIESVPRQFAENIGEPTKRDPVGIV